MLLTCPSCSSTYEVADGAIGSAGRKVRCTFCSHVWMATPNTDLPIETTEEVLTSVADAVREAVDNFDDDVSEETTVDEADHIDDDDDLMFTDEQSDSSGESEAPDVGLSADIDNGEIDQIVEVDEDEPVHSNYDEKEDRASRREAKVLREQERERLARKQRIVTTGWAVWLVFILGVLATLYFAKEQVLNTFPGMQKLYDYSYEFGHPEEFIDVLPIEEQGPKYTDRQLPNLKITVDTPIVVDEDGIKKIKITGKILSQGKQTFKIYKLIGVFKDASGRTVGEWTFDPEMTLLSRGATLEFSSTHGPIPAGSSIVTLDLLLNDNKRYNDLQAGGGS